MGAAPEHLTCEAVNSADGDGRFKLNRAPFGTYKLVVSRPEYLTIEIGAIQVSVSNSRIHLKNLKLQENVVMLDEVMVVHHRIKGEEKIDKTVFAINDGLRKASTSGLDLLKHIPSATTVVTKRINTMRDTPGVPEWQRIYFEHIIKDDTDYKRIPEYILTNPRRWKEDKLNPANPPFDPQYPRRGGRSSFYRTITC